jgi:hypothetical protein
MSATLELHMRLMAVRLCRQGNAQRTRVQTERVGWSAPAGGMQCPLMSAWAPIGAHNPSPLLSPCIILSLGFYMTTAERFQAKILVTSGLDYYYGQEGSKALVYAYYYHMHPLEVCPEHEATNGRIASRG